METVIQNASNRDAQQEFVRIANMIATNCRTTRGILGFLNIGLSVFEHKKLGLEWSDSRLLHTDRFPFALRQWLTDFSVATRVDGSAMSVT